MKKLLVGLLALGSLSTYADADFQKANITGTWKSAGSSTMLIKHQTDSTIKVFHCNEKTYANEGKCVYYAIAIYKYNSELDAYYYPGIANQYCPDSIQVSQDTPSELLMVINPLNTMSNCGETGRIAQFSKNY